MRERILFLTGHLAEPQLLRVLSEMGDAGFDWTVFDLGLQVAGLMTADMVARRLPHDHGADRILVPGRCRGDVAALSERFGVPVERGPDELMDLPEFFGREAQRPDLSAHAVKVFAEITEAPRMDLPAIVAAADAYRTDGADVIDLGCLPGTPFPHLEDAVRALHDAGHRVSVDSLDRDELLRGGSAGADYLLSLTLDTLDIAEQVPSTPVLVPTRPADLDSLFQAMEHMDARGLPYLADPILEPIPFGFAASLVRYHAVRQRAPEAPMLMGIGNVTELTDADTPGMHALLVGLMTELDIGALLTTQVSPHCRSAVREIDAARRMMHAARAAHSLPRGISDALLGLRHRRPFPYAKDDIEAVAAQVRDPNFRVQLSAEGIHIYNRDGMRSGTDPFALWPQLGVEDDASHAFYLGVELARAQIAWQLGKRYAQDEALDWGCMVTAPEDDAPRCEARDTARHRRRAPAA